MTTPAVSSSESAPSGCYGCGKTAAEGITEDCICDPGGAEFFQYRIAFVLSKDGQDRQIRELPADLLEALEVVTLEWYDRYLDEDAGSHTLEQMKRANKIPWFRMHLDHTAEFAAEHPDHPRKQSIAAEPLVRTDLP